MSLNKVTERVLSERLDTNGDSRWLRIEAAAVAIAGGMASRMCPIKDIPDSADDVAMAAESIVEAIDRRRAESSNESA